jgi:transposase InsO family protein
VNDQQKQRIEQIALFRFGVLGDLVHLTPGEVAIYQQLKEKAEREYQIPFTTRTRVAAETIRDWLKSYRKAGFDGLKPKPRADLGESRAIPREIADLLLTLKEEHPESSVRQVIAWAQDSGKLPEGIKLKPTTVNRLLGRHGLMDRETPAADKDRRRFAFQKAGELWMSDVMHGPAVLVGKQRRKTYLIAFLDDATRVVPYAAFACSESTAAFLPILKQAVLRRGVPLRLFVDNGAAYRSQHLSLVCAKLGVTLIHARPYQPQSKGKMERFFRTVRMQLMPALSSADLSSVEALNRRLWAYIETEYHRAPHKGIEGDCPLDRWARTADEVRYLDENLDDLFLAEAQRKVHADRVVSLNGVAYEVDASLVGEMVTLRYDPTLKGRAIQVHFGGKQWTAKVVDTYGNCFVKRDRPSQSLAAATSADAPAPGLRLRDLEDDKEDR